MCYCNYQQYHLKPQKKIFFDTIAIYWKILFLKVPINLSAAIDFPSLYVE